MTTPPLALIAELTHRCPLHCVYCSNPLQLRANFEELPTEVWIQVLKQAAKLGMFQAHCTGGKRLARSALHSLVSVAHSLDLYTNLITSGIGLNEKKLASLIAAGLDHMQLSFQDSNEGSADRVAGVPVHARKVALANLIHECKSLAFTVNLVVHRHNLDRLESIISFAESLGPQRIEIANVQYYGWALKNREWLLPTCEQVQRSVLIVQRAQERLKGRIKVDFVTPDYYASFPKPCMGGWGCQAFLVTGDEAATDPVCSLAPAHSLIEERISHANLSCGPDGASLPPSWTYRTQSVPSSPRSPLQAERTEGRVSDTPTS